MWLWFVVMVPLGILFIVSAGKEADGAQAREWYRRPFYKAAAFLTDLRYRERCGDGKRYREIRKTETVLIILVCGMAVLLLLEGEIRGGIFPVRDNELARPEKGQGDISMTLEAQLEDEDPRKIQLQIRERQYSREEKTAMLKQAAEELDVLFSGENGSSGGMRGTVPMPSSLQHDEVAVQWIVYPDGILKEDGSIPDDVPKEGTELSLTAVLTCFGEEMTYEKKLRIFPPLRSAEEELVFSLEKAVKEAEEESIELGKMTLPDQVNGRRITWITEKQSLLEAGILLIAVLAIAGYAGVESEIRREAAERKRHLLLDYPDVVFKMSMLLDAGLTIQNAFVKIAEEYRASSALQEDGRKREVYEEMLSACHEMQSGTSEAKAYENFGRRCGETCYIRLGSVLSSGLQKSAEGITELLLKESVNAMEERRQLAKKLGEEAGTKLLFPMILMLMVVLVILMVPAVMAF